MMPTAAIVSYRIGGSDGVSVEAVKWRWALEQLGWSVVTVAGDGSPDRLVPGIGLDRAVPPDRTALDAALDGCELFVAENICSLPVNPAASAAVAEALAGRCAIVHHHDLACERPQLRHLWPPPDSQSWLHVCINEGAVDALASVGIEAVLVRNCFDADPPVGDRDSCRRALGVAPQERLVLQPTRAIARKNIPGGIGLARSLGATYWLLGAAEDGYDRQLESHLAGAAGRVLRGAPHGIGLDDCYAACDVVVMPSTSEGFGNPALEASVRRKPLAVGTYPVAGELRRYGFRWFDCDDPEPLAAFLSSPDPRLLDHNAAVARRHFSLMDLPSLIEELVARVTAKPPLHRPMATEGVLFFR